MIEFIVFHHLYSFISADTFLTNMNLTTINLSLPSDAPLSYIITADKLFMPAVRQRPHMYLLFSLLYCAVIRLSQTAQLSL